MGHCVKYTPYGRRKIRARSANSGCLDYSPLRGSTACMNAIVLLSGEVNRFGVAHRGSDNIHPAATRVRLKLCHGYSSGDSDALINQWTVLVTSIDRGNGMRPDIMIGDQAVRDLHEKTSSLGVVRNFIIINHDSRTMFKIRSAGPLFAGLPPPWYGVRIMTRTLLLLLIAVFAQAETKTIVATRFYNSFDHRHPELARIKNGDTVVTKTIDASGYDENTKKAGERSNPLTGPFFIEGAEPGDAIAVTFNRIRMNRNFGWTASRLGLYALSPETIEGLFSSSRPRGAALPDRENLMKWDIDLSRNTVKLAAPVSKVHRMEFPAKPMLGCVGVAAPGVFGPTSGISGNYGGNMDYNRINEGSTVILPVFHSGALLFIGDGHALQADGEPTGTGVETTMDVTFTVAVRKRAGVQNQRVETADSIIAVGSQPEFVSSLDRSLRVATSEMLEWLTRDFKMEPWAAHMLIGYQGQYDVITVAGTMGLRLAKSSLPSR
jgi:amidase